ncbi:MAG TPA: TetR/AcrR family transcriptional regulator [Pyrinomonadaceae bacterium]|nr:TetR/AcrR family transcriptional regulator [Pyrinomonadaceae bacterium]
MSKQPITSESNALIPPTAAVASTANASATARMAGEERRLQILLVAISLFARKGFRGTTTKEIAQAAGVSEAMVFRHFATKEELYSAILDHKACAGGNLDLCEGETVSAAILRKDDRAVFESLALALLQHHEHDTEFLGLLTYAALERHQLAQMFWERNVQQVYEQLGAYIRERQREGALREIEPRIVVRAFLGMVIHHSLNNSLWDPTRRLLDISNEQAAREFTSLLLSGITADNTNAILPKGTRSGKVGRVQKGTAKKKQTK